MLTIACVLRVSGGIYNEKWVRRLQKNVSDHLTIPHRFVCLSNLDHIDGTETIPLTDNFPGWWSKIELFKPNQFEDQVLYMDLDMMACGNMDKLIDNWNSLVMLRDCPVFRQVSNSGLMYFDVCKVDLSFIYTEFKNNMMNIMKDYSGINGVTMFGDQGFIEKTMISKNIEIAKWQDILPHHWFLEFSYLDKLNPKFENDSYDKDVRICYSLGHPKFTDLPNIPLVKQHWNMI